MQSYYFTILCYKRQKLEWIVEMEKLSRVADFLIKSEPHRAQSHHECEIHIKKDYVSASGASVDLEIFKAYNPNALMRLALEAK